MHFSSNESLEGTQPLPLNLESPKRKEAWKSFARENVFTKNTNLVESMVGRKHK
jgi:hypothetical protein